MIRRHWFYAILVLLSVHAPAVNSETPADTSLQGTVVSILDGDEIKVRSKGKRITVQLHGIDCPEKDQPFGTKANQLTSKLVRGKSVRVIPVDRQADEKGRIRAEVYFRRTDVIEIHRGNRIMQRKVTVSTRLGEELVRAGLAWWHKQRAPNDEELARLESEARKAGRGLWSAPAPVAPWLWRDQRKTRRSR